MFLLGYASLSLILYHPNYEPVLITCWERGKKEEMFMIVWQPGGHTAAPWKGVPRTLGKVSGVRCSAILHRLDGEVELDGGLAVSKDIRRIQILTCMDINTVSLIKQFNASENR